MRISDVLAEYILDLLEKSDGYAEIQRNELANLIGCVPSQISYVLMSRFTPEQGYIVESKRGGGGYIKITKVKINKSSAIMHIINSVGDKLSSETCRILIQNMLLRELLTEDSAKLISCATSTRIYSVVPEDCRNSLRANIFKNMLLTQI